MWASTTVLSSLQLCVPCSPRHKSGMSSIRSSAAGNWVYQNLFKRNSSYFALILVGAIVVESGVSRGVDAWWRIVNRGKTWDDFKRTQLPKIQAKKAAAEESEEADE